MRTIFNPLANISAAETKKQQTNWKTNKKSKLHDGLSKSLNAISGSSTRDDKKQFKAFELLAKMIINKWSVMNF